LSCCQIWSCCHRHSWLSHPSHMYHFPMLSCASSGEFCVVRRFGVVQLRNLCISCLRIVLLVPSAFNHSSSCFNDFSQRSQASAFGHSSMCCLSLIGSGHLGHLVIVLNFHLFMFLPIAKWPDTYLVTHCCRLRGTSCIVLPMDSQSIRCQIPSVSARHFSQYAHVTSPLMWSLMWLPKKFSTHCVPV